MPLDGIEDAILKRLRRTARVSCERICSGPGIIAIYETLASLEGRAVPSRDDREIWAEALEGTDSIASPHSTGSASLWCRRRRLCVGAGAKPW
jgi:glucokinase